VALQNKKRGRAGLPPEGGRAGEKDATPERGRAERWGETPGLFPQVKIEYRTVMTFPQGIHCMRPLWELNPSFSRERAMS
jgi:hypothetical protein